MRGAGSTEGTDKGIGFAEKYMAEEIIPSPSAMVGESPFIVLSD